MHAIHVSLYTIIFLVALALIFDFMNGFHDAANAIATVVSTGVLKPHTAVAMTAFMLSLFSCLTCMWQQQLEKELSIQLSSIITLFLAHWSAPLAGISSPGITASLHLLRMP